jgi:hypothetical protein
LALRLPIRSSIASATSPRSAMSPPLTKPIARSAGEASFSSRIAASAPPCTISRP